MTGTLRIGESSACCRIVRTPRFTVNSVTQVNSRFVLSQEEATTASDTRDSEILNSRLPFSPHLSIPFCFPRWSNDSHRYVYMLILNCIHVHIRVYVVSVWP